jgi:hypothetical protein
MEGNDPGQVEDVKTAGNILRVFRVDGLNGFKGGERKWVGDH